VIVVGAVVLIVLVGAADVRFGLRRHGDDRRAVLAGHVGRHLTIVHQSGALTESLTGLVRGISRRDVRVRVVASEVSVPVKAIDEIWLGRSLVRRW
jgi:hypothetical protein